MNKGGRSELSVKTNVEIIASTKKSIFCFKKNSLETLLDKSGENDTLWLAPAKFLKQKNKLFIERVIIFKNLIQNDKYSNYDKNVFHLVFLVIDFCLTKCLMTDTASTFTALRLCWASRNSCRQRSGRAGRVMNGRCYRLVYKTMFYVIWMISNNILQIISIGKVDSTKIALLFLFGCGSWLEQLSQLEQLINFLQDVRE